MASKSNTGTFAGQLAARRAERFVGRQRELAQWRHFITAANDRPLWFVCGLAGIGKTALLRRFQAEGNAGGTAPVYLDARHIPASPPTAHNALTAALTATEPASPATAAAQTQIVLIDSFEYWEELEGWFRSTFLPAQSANLHIVFAGRRDPDRDWFVDSGYKALMTHTRLGPLSRQEAGTYLWRRQVTSSRQQRLIELSGGHPLTLALATDAVHAGRTLSDSLGQADDDLIGPLVECFTREFGSSQHSSALNAAAVVRELNVPLLEKMLSVDDASDLYVWLSRLSFMTTTETGLMPHELVRDGLMRVMPDRAPGEYETLARNAALWTIERIETATELSLHEATVLAANAMYALRAAPLIRHYITPAHNADHHRALYLDCWRTGDAAMVHPMIARHEGQESLGWFRFWHDKGVGGVLVLRDAEERPVACLLRLDMETLNPADRAADPLTRKLWQALQTDFNIYPGDHIPFVRHWVTHDYAVSDSPEKTRLLMAMHAYNMTASNLRLSAQVFDESGNWEQPAAALGIQRLNGSDTVIGTKNWRIYYNDWRQEPPMQYYRRFVDRVLACALDDAGQPVIPVGPVSSLGTDLLNENAFSRAVEHALKHFHKSTVLAKNDLLQKTLLAAGQAGHNHDQQARLATLRTIVQAGVGGLHSQQARILEATYLQPGSSQKTAAQQLHMGYSTFRRHLAKAHKALAVVLWKQELDRRRGAPATATPWAGAPSHGETT